jgi:hypothetical protein
MTWLPFSMTANEAHRWSETTGWQPPFARFQRWYIARLFEASSVDRFLYRRLNEVMHFVAPPTSLFAPRVIAHMMVAGSRSERERPLRLPTASSSAALSSARLSLSTASGSFHRTPW